jgi:NADH:ubiquinone oxidoreductase subunit E
MRPRIGVYVCHCGTNIASKVDISAAVQHAAGLRDVVIARDYKFMCSEPGQDIIRNDINKLKLDRVVVASCSPLMHERTFRKTCSDAGLNGYLMQMANIREHCSWVSEDTKAATAKARRLISSAVHKARLLEPLEPRYVDVNPNVLVVGAGIAGIQAALDIADAGNKVYLVEKAPCIGGHMAQFDKTFPTLDCAACILTPKMVQVGQHENIEILSYSEVENVSGYIGNFNVKVREKARSVDVGKCTGCGECMKACLVTNRPDIRKEPDASEGLSESDKVEIESVIERHGAEASSLIQVMQEINERNRYLPEKVLRYISQRLAVPLPQVYHVATFYTSFSLEPRGEHSVRVCVGTACHARGADQVLAEIERILEIQAGETTPDRKFSLETVNCLGCCALGPVVVVDDDYHSVRPSGVEAMLKEYRD